MAPSDDSNSSADGQNRARRTSFTTPFNALLGRPGTTGINPFPGPITTAAAQDQRRRMSTSGASPTQSSVFNRRFSVSTNNSDTIPESAIDDDESPSSTGGSLSTPFARRMSRAAEDVLNGSSALRRSLGNAAHGRAPSHHHPPRSPQAAKQASMTSSTRAPSDTRRSGETFNWSEQIRSRAESSVSSAAGRPSFSSASPPAVIHERAKGGAQTVPKQDAPPPPPTLKERIYSKPDDIGERMLKGDYYY